MARSLLKTIPMPFHFNPTKDTNMRNASKAILLAGITSAALAASVAHAQAPAAAPATPEHTLTGNVGLYSEYLFRGIAQTAGKPAIQGGFDYAHSSGFYLGTWATNISWLGDFGAYSRSSLEWDFYGGYKATFAEDFTYDVGVLYYYYPGKANPGITKADTFEGYVGLGWKFLSAKFSYNFKDYFGANPTGEGTDGTWYLDLGATYPIGDSGASIVAHYGILDVNNDGTDAGEVSYEDWKLGLAYVIPDGMLKGAEIGAYYSGNNAKEGFYTDLTGYNTAKDRGVIYLKKTF
jgi:uncharacterized protein (TIGR02001 family)